jgi:tetratricopeptide (TPR) repeat protein
MSLLMPQFGRFDQARAFAHKALELEPDNPAYYVRFVYACPIENADLPVVQRLRSFSKAGTFSSKMKSGIEYALGKAAEDFGLFDEAGEHYLKANKIALDEQNRSGRSYDPQAHGKEVDFIIDSFTAEKISSFGVRRNSSAVPVFVIGMMRSGTTLAEQVLSSHPEIGAGGELAFWRDHGPRLHEGLVRNRQTAQLEAAAEYYLTQLGSIGPDKTLVCDKLPQNYLMAGLIHTVLPNAKFIHCRRDSRDTCLSLFTTPFTYPPGFAHDPVAIAFAYRQYLRLMDHWSGVLPEDRLLTVHYEDLVTNRESTTRRMIEFLDLTWDERCLFPEQNPRALANPSQWQARQPVYRKSLGRWKRFMPCLEPQINLWEISES